MSFHQEIQRKHARIVAKAWNDPEFKRRLIKDPKKVLQEEGIDVPDHVEIRVVENTDTVFYLTIPPKPSDEISDDQLDSVSGGLFIDMRNPWR